MEVFRPDYIIKKVGVFSAWVAVLLVLIVCIDTILRYFFSITRTWVVELEWHMYSVIFLLGAAYTLQKDKHVRVDVFYQGFSAKKKSIVNAIGHIVFLIPWCYVILSTSYRFVWTSLMIGEGSPNPDGLPYRFIIKGMILIGFGLLLFQAFVSIFKELSNLFDKSPINGA
jgi:TRAP-type mannitol/chloroaromatic compound transport system permease small subunit